MKKLAPLTLIAALFLAGCANDTEADSSTSETATEKTAEERQLENQAKRKAEEAENERTPPDMSNLTAQEQAVLNARPDHELYDRYSDESVIEDAQHTCRHIEINIDRGNTIALHTLDQIYTNNQNSQSERVNSSEYPDDTPYIRDMEYPVEQALVHMCPEHLEDVEREAFDVISAFSTAGQETGYVRFTDDGYEFTN